MHDKFNCIIGGSVHGEGGTAPTVGVKDNTDVKGLPTTNGTNWRDVVATADSEIVARIRRSGDFQFVKTNMDEYALGGYGRNPTFGDIINPGAPSRIVGGSSSGSAAAVRAGLCAWSTGTDTGGSVRMPAAYCGVVGLKPTFGMVPVDGICLVSEPLDTVGILAPNISATIDAFERIAPGELNRDLLNRDIEDFRLLSPLGWTTHLDADTSAVWRSVEALTKPIQIGDLGKLYEIHRRVSRYTVWRDHSSLLEQHPERYGVDARDYLADAQAVDEEEYWTAVTRMESLRTSPPAMLDDLDVLLLPTMSSVAPRVGHLEEVSLKDLSMLVKPFNVLGWPALSLPGPRLDGRLAVGIQVVGAPGREDSVLAVGRALERKWQRWNDSQFSRGGL